MKQVFVCTCKKEFPSQTSLLKHRSQSKRCARTPKFTETALRRLGKLPRLEASVDVTDDVFGDMHNHLSEVRFVHFPLV